MSVILGRFSVGVTSAIELQRWIETSQASTNAAGYPAGQGTEVYAQIELWRVSPSATEVTWGNRIGQTSATTGSGTLTLTSMSPVLGGHQLFGAEIGSGDQVLYCIVNDGAGDLAEWEIGFGVYTDSGRDETLSRDLVLQSSSNDGLVSFGDGADLDVTIIHYPGVEPHGYAVAVDQQTSGTAQTFTASGGDAFASRVKINAERSDVGANVSISGEQLTLQPGTYDVFAVATVYDAGRCALRLRDVTNGETAIHGLTTFAQDDSGEEQSAQAMLLGRIVVDTAATFELQLHRQLGSTGQAALTTGDVEAYALVELRRVGE